MKNLEPRTQVRWLCVAIEDGDLPEIQKLLAGGCPTSHPEVPKSPVMYAIERDSAPIMDELHRAGAFDAQDVDSIFVDAMTQASYAVALRMLELGADPSQHVGPTEETPESRRSALLYSVARGAHQLVHAILERLSQQQKDRELRDAVRKGFARCVQTLIDAGADGAQLVNGRTLIETAHPQAEEVKRILRSFDTARAINAAMSDGADDAPPATSSFTL